MPGKVHIPKLTRTACGKKLTDKTRLDYELIKFLSRWPTMAENNEMCEICYFSNFMRGVKKHRMKLHSIYAQRFGRFPPDANQFIDLAREHTIEAYQEKGFNV